MAKIRPTTILPYTKTTIKPNTDKNSVNIRNALSAAKQQKNETINDMFRVINAAAAHNLYIDTETSGHIGVTLSAWRNRKT